MPHKLKICVGFVSSEILITYLTYKEDFVMVLRAAQNGPCLQCVYVGANLPSDLGGTLTGLNIICRVVAVVMGQGRG